MEPTATKPKVLIIDDSPTMQRIVQTAFPRERFDVSIASDGSEGIHSALMNPPNIIILDIVMEGLHGFEVCKMLRANSSMRRTAIIVISGKAYKSDIDRAIELGADSYIVKPFLPKEIHDIAIEHMNNRANLP